MGVIKLQCEKFIHAELGISEQRSGDIQTEMTNVVLDIVIEPGTNKVKGLAQNVYNNGLLKMAKRMNLKAAELLYVGIISADIAENAMKVIQEVMSNGVYDSLFRNDLYERSKKFN